MDTSPRTNPYVGLRPFEEADSLYFFGRRQQVSELLQRLQQSRLVAVVGSSGSGKSSLVKAGLIPRLRAGYLVENRSLWNVAALKPGENPLYHLVEALALALQLQPKALQADVELRGVDALLEVLTTQYEGSGQNLLILVDQFEELFRFSDRHAAAAHDEAQDFVWMLLALAQAAALPLYVVITMRSDFIGDCARFYDLPEALNAGQYLVPRLTRAQRQQAIEGPARVMGAPLHPRLTDRLLNEGGQYQDELPLLQHVLQRTYEAWQAQGSDGFEDLNKGSDRSGDNGKTGPTPTPLSLDHYQSTGGINNALSRHIDEVLDELAPEDVHLVRRLFQQLTTTDKGGRRVRRPARLTALAQDTGADPTHVRALLDRFRTGTRTFLVRTPVPEHPEDFLYDITHEALIRQWGPLHQTAEEDAQRAEALYVALPEADQVHLERIFKALTTLAPDGLRYLRRPTRQTELAAILGEQPSTLLPLLGRLTEGEAPLLLRTPVPNDAEDRMLDLAQDGLVQAWPRLYTWAKEETKGVELYQDLCAAAKQHQQGKRGLLQQPELALTNNWRLMHQPTQAWGVRYEADYALAMAFLDASLAEEEKNRQFLTKRTKRRNQLITLILLIVGSAALLALRFGWQAQQAERETEDVKEAYRLISLAQQLEAATPPVALRIAEAALGKLDNPDVRSRASRIYHDNSFFQAKLTGHNSYVTAVAWSPVGDQLATTSDDGTAILWDAQGNKLKTLTGHSDRVNAVAWSPDGQQLATASDDGTAILWDAQGNQTKTLGHSNAVEALAWSPDGEQLATASDDGTAILWDAQGNQTKTLTGHSGALFDVAWSPKGDQIATASIDDTAIIWDAQGNQRHILKGHKDLVLAVAWSPRGDQLATVSWDGTAILWDSQGNQTKTLNENALWINTAWSPQGDQLATASENGTIILLDTQGNHLHTLKGHSDNTNALVWSPQGDQLATASRDGTAILWDAQGNKLKTLKGHRSGVTAVAWSPTSDRLATASLDGTAILWDAQGNQLHTLQVNSMWMKGVAWSPRGDQLAIAFAFGTTILWDTQGNQRNILQGHHWGVSAVAWSPDGEQLATASSNGTAILWDTKGNRIKTLKGHRSGVTAVAWSPTSDRLATASRDGTAILWDAQGNQLHTLQGHHSTMEDVVWSPSGDRLATASDDGTAILWDAQGNQLHTLKGYSRNGQGLVWSPSGDRLATAYLDAAILWDAQGKQLHTLQGHHSTVETVVWSPSGDRLATAYRDAAILWDAQGNLIKTLTGHSRALTALAWSPNGDQLATASDDDTAIIWDAQGYPTKTLTGHSRALTALAWSPDGEQLATASYDGTAIIWRAPPTLDEFLASDAIPQLTAEQKAEYGIE